MDFDNIIEYINDNVYFEWISFDSLEHLHAPSTIHFPLSHPAYQLPEIIYGGGYSMTATVTGGI